MLDRGCEVHFFSKASFVDPRPALGGHPAFRFTDVDNRLTDSLRAGTQRIPGIRFATRLLDVECYNRKLVRSIAREHSREPFDVCVWFGDYARGRIPGLPTVSFAQGAPGTDARSVARRFPEIVRVAGWLAAWKWRLLAAVRLSKFGLPRFGYSDLIVVASPQSCRMLLQEYQIPETRTASVPFPIDLDLFHPAPGPARTSRTRCLWLGRIVPRKRFDLFLDGVAEAIRSGRDVEATVVGTSGFIPGYEKLIGAFPYPDRLKWIPSIPRSEVPDMLRSHDMVIQPSEEEDFGSSVAEAQACGIPVIVGATNGNADYLCAADIRLQTDDPRELAAAIVKIASRPQPTPIESRAFAETMFGSQAAAIRLVEVLDWLVRSRQGTKP